MSTFFPDPPPPRAAAGPRRPGASALGPARREGPASARQDGGLQSELPPVPGIRFPASRAALWDSSPTGRAVQCTPATCLPTVHATESLLRGVSRSVAAKAPACLVCGTAGRELAGVGGIHLIAASSRARTLPTDDESMASTLTARLLPFVPAGGAVDAAVLATAAPLLPPELSHKAQCIPVYGPGEPQRLANIAGSGSSGEEAEDVVYRTMIAEATRACATEGEAPWQLCALRLFVERTAARESTAPAVTARLEGVLPSTTFTCRPIVALPLLETPLVHSLRRADGGAPHRSGYVTMDQARSAVLMLERDPLAPTCPVVGAWVTSADPANAPASDEDSGRVWAACQRFLSSSSLRDRVLVQSPEQRGGDGSTEGGGAAAGAEAPRSFLLIAVPCGRGDHACFHVTPRRVRWMGAGGGAAQAAAVEFSRWESPPCELPSIDDPVGAAHRASGDGQVVQLRLRPAGTLRRRRAFLRAQGSDAEATRGAGRGGEQKGGGGGAVTAERSGAALSWELRVPDSVGDAAPAVSQLALPHTTAAAPVTPQWVAAVGAAGETQATQRREIRSLRREVAMLRAQLEQARIDAALSASQQLERLATRDASTQAGGEEGAAGPTTEGAAHSRPRQSWETPTPPRMRTHAAGSAEEEPQRSGSFATPSAVANVPAVGVTSSSSLSYSSTSSAAAAVKALPRPAPAASRCADAGAVVSGALVPDGARPVVGRSRGVFEAAGGSTSFTDAGAGAGAGVLDDADDDDGYSEEESDEAYRMRLPGEERGHVAPAAVYSSAPAAAAPRPAGADSGDRHLLDHYASLFGSTGPQSVASTAAPAPAVPPRSPDVPAVAIPRSLLEDAAFGSFAVEGSSGGGGGRGSGGGSAWLSTAVGSDGDESDDSDSAAWDDAVRAVEARYLGGAAVAGGDQ